MRDFLVTIVGNMAGLWLATVVLPGLAVATGASTGYTALNYAIVALILTLLNMFIRPVLKFFSFPLYILTFGLFSLVVNAAIIGLTGWLSAALSVSGFWTALFAGLIITIISTLVTGILDRSDA